MDAYIYIHILQAGTVDVAAFDRAWQCALTSAHVIIPDAASVISSSGSCSYNGNDNGSCAAVTNSGVTHPGSADAHRIRHRGGRDRLLRHHSRDTGE
jgi:hypothetical protein